MKCNRRSARRACRRYAGTAVAVAAFLAALPTYGDTPTSTTSSSGGNILDPNTAPIIVIHIGRHRLVMIPTHQGVGDSTTITAQAIESKANAQTFSILITSVVAGAAQAPSGEFH